MGINNAVSFKTRIDGNINIINSVFWNSQSFTFINNNVQTEKTLFVLSL